MNGTDFTGRASSQLGPAMALRAVTPNDIEDLPDGLCRSLFIGVAGDVAILDATGQSVILSSGACQYHPVQARRVLSTGTSAHRIIAIY